MTDKDTPHINFHCPLPPRAGEHITLAHGGGGQLSQDLLQQIIAPTFGPQHQGQTDSAKLPWAQGGLAFTTDSYVVNPAFFPGGHIGQLAVIGTANDLAMIGAQIQFLSCSLIIEEGFDMAKLQHILHDMQDTAQGMNAQIVTGDTKVVERGKGDGLFINTSGIGRFSVAPTASQNSDQQNIAPQNTVRPNSDQENSGQQEIGPHRITGGDCIIVSGDLGRHGASIMAHRDGIDIADLISDLAWLGPKVNALLDNGIAIHCMRDLTRGGLVSALYECAQSANLSFRIEANQLPISDPVQCFCELTGIDPLHLANEGRFVLFCPPTQQDQVLSLFHAWDDSQNARVIGQVTERSAHLLVQKTAYGTERILMPPLGDQFPRIC